jgi:hypothetical protein
MNTQNENRQESRTSRYNFPVHHPSKWRLIEKLLASPMRLHRYRTLSHRMLEDVAREKYCGDCK